MVDSVQVFDPGYRVTDASGNPVNGAKIKFRTVGGGAPLEVFSHKDLGAPDSLGSIVRTRSDGYPVVSFGSNTTVLIYLGTTPYNIEITDANDMAIFPAKDNVRGALDTSAFLTADSPSTLSIAVVHQATNKALGTSDNGKVFNATDAITFTLGAAATLGDGWNVRLRNGCSSDLTVKLVASQNIDLPPKTTTAIVLRKGEGYSIACNGSKFTAYGYTPPYFAGLLGVMAVADIITALPASPVAGARYVIGTAFSSYAQHEVIEADGQGGWIQCSVPTDIGLIAWVQDENRYYRFQDSAWVLALEPDASDTVKGLIALAAQTDMETGTDVLKAVVPGRQHFHPGHPKAWADYSVAGVVSVSYNVSSVTDNGAGTWSPQIATDFSSANYSVQPGLNDNQSIATQITSRAAGSFNQRAFATTTGTLTDPSGSVMFAAQGDL